MTASDTPIDFVEHLNAMRMDEAFTLIDPDIVYHNIPMNPVRGYDAVQAMVDLVDCEAMAWIIHASAQSLAPDRLVTAWRDCFGLARWTAQMAPPA